MSDDLWTETLKKSFEMQVEMAIRKPTTNPTIDGQPMSFVRLRSAVETPLRLVVPDDDGELVRLYEQGEDGAVKRVGNGQPKRRAPRQRLAL